MKIAILGTRGIPNAYGGFEQCAQYLAEGLTVKGHRVWVYCSADHPYKEEKWNGVHLVHIKDPEKQIGTVGQFLYDLYCNLDAKKKKFDVILHLGYTSDSIWHKLWPKDAANIVNMDGLEWKRSKYNAITKRFLKYAERIAAINADVLISDSPGIQSYIHEKYGLDSIYIPYGAEIPAKFNSEKIGGFGLEPGSYYLAIARMEPENNIEMIITGYLASSQKIPLVLVGNYTNEFGAAMKKRYASSRIIFTGGIYDQDSINSLRHFSRIYFHGHSVGGTNPSLLEAMACGCNIAAHNNIFNRAVLEDGASYFLSAEEVSTIADENIDVSAVERTKQININKINNIYNWNRVIDLYENALQSSPK